MKKYSLCLAAIAAASILSACGGAAGETTAAATTAAETVTEAQAASEAESTEKDAETEAQASGDIEQTEPLLVYLNDFDAVIPDMFKEATGYDVEVVVGNGAETMSRIEAESSNPQWDVVWLDSMYDIYNLDLDGQLMTGLEPENAAGLTDFAKALVPEDKSFYPTGAHAAGVIVYRTDVYDDTTAPKTFDDFTDERFRDQVGMADPGVAAPAYPLAAYFMDKLGLEGGQEYFTKLFENGLKVYPKNPQVVQALASGEISAAILQESNAYEMVNSGEPVAIIWPEDGAPASTRVAAICAQTDQPEIAQIFVNFLLDPETQQALINTGDEGYFEASVEGVEEKEDRAADAKLVAADVVFGAENEADIKAWFADMSAM